MGSTSSATFLRKHRLAGAAISPRGFRRALRGSNQHPNEPSLLYNDPPCIPSSGFSELPSRSLLLCSVISSRGCAPLAVLRIAVIITTRNDCRLSLTTITDPDSMPSLDSAPSITTIRRQISSFLLFTRSARPSHCARSCPLDLSGAFGCFKINSLARKLGLDCGCFTKQTDRRSYPWLETVVVFGWVGVIDEVLSGLLDLGARQEGIPAIQESSEPKRAGPSWISPGVGPGGRVAQDVKYQSKETDSASSGCV